jgi:calcineurin-like phosphoesterase family protein
MSNVWITSDNHWGHKNIIKYCNRPFSSVEEMNETLIDNWNSVVKSTDMVYHLGDFGFGKPEYLLDIFKRLNGSRKVLIKGNHDKDSLKLPWTSVHDLLEVTINEKIYNFCHFPMRTWNKSFHGSRSCFGHCHGMLKPHGYSCDVGVDSWDYTPVSIDTLEKLFEKLPRFIPDTNNEQPAGKIWQGRECMLSFETAFVGDGTYDNVDPDLIENKDPDEFKK